MGVLSIKNILQKLKENIAYVLLVIVSVIVGLLVYIYMQNERAPKITYETSLGEYEQKSDSWGNLYFDESINLRSPQNMNVYDVRTANDSEVDKIVKSLGFGEGYEEDSEFDEFRVWTFEESFVRFDKDAGDLVADFTTSPLDLDRIDGVTLSEDSSKNKEYFEEFINLYLALPGDFEVLVEVNSEDEVFKFSAIEQLNGYPVTKAFGPEYSVIAELNSRGQLLNLYASVVLFTKAESEGIINFDELKKNIYLDDFPKESFTYAKEEPDSCTSDDCDEYGFYSFEGFKQASITEANLAYYFDLNKSNNVNPVYELSGDGIVKAQNSINYEVDVKVLANALDLELIGID